VRGRGKKRRRTAMKTSRPLRHFYLVSPPSPRPPLGPVFSLLFIALLVGPGERSQQAPRNLAFWGVWPNNKVLMPSANYTSFVSRFFFCSHFPAAPADSFYFRLVYGKNRFLNLICSIISEIFE